MSKGERAIASYLMEKRIPFVTDKTFPDCRDRAELRFDFYLPNQVILIAYDGLQHFEAIEAFGGQSGLETLQKHDQMKMRYAVDNRIKLICIDGNSLGRVEALLDTYLGNHEMLCLSDPAVYTYLNV